MLKINLKCPVHPRYNPAKDGEGAIRGGCAKCTSLYFLYEQALAYEGRKT